MSRLPVLFLFAFMNCLTLAGQKLHFQFSHLDISRGLSNNQVTGIFKDQKGFLWVGTMSGLNRYDGYQFKYLEIMQGLHLQFQATLFQVLKNVPEVRFALIREDKTRLLKSSIPCAGK
jgi:ligand-binding sensor domain-containing protein